MDENSAQGGGAAGAAVSKRGRPTAARVEAINRQILAAAKAEFLGAGFEGATMESVAGRAGVSKGTLYARYPTKEDLLQAVVREQIEAMSRAAKRSDHLLTGSMEQRLRHHARMILLSLNSEEMRAFEKLIGLSEAAPAFARSLYETGYRFALDMLAGEIIVGTRGDPQPARRPEQVAEMLLAMLHGWMYQRRAVGQVTDEAALAYADVAVDLIYAGRQAW